MLGAIFLFDHWEQADICNVVQSVALICFFSFMARVSIRSTTNYFDGKTKMFATFISIPICYFLFAVLAFGDVSMRFMLLIILAVIIPTSMTFYFSFPDYVVLFASYVCPPLARAARENIEEHLEEIEIEPTHGNLKRFSGYFKRYGRFIKSLELRGNEVKGKDLWHLLKHCTKLKRLDLVDVDIHDLPLNDADNVLALDTLRLVRCIGGDYEFARIVSACEGLEVLVILECMPESVERISESIFRKTPKIRALTIDPVSWFVREISIPENFTEFLMIQNVRGIGLASSVGALAASKTLYRNLLLYGVSLDEDFRLIVDSLPLLPELECCVIATEHQLSEEKCALFPSFTPAKYIEEKNILMPRSDPSECSYNGDYYYVYSRYRTKNSCWAHAPIGFCSTLVSTE